MIPALVLTAGLATRLRPLSRVRAKAALPVAGRPLVERILERLVAAGVRDVVLNLHHLPHTITARVGDGSQLGVQVRYSWESPLLGSGGGPRRALPLLDAGRFFIVNGDTMTDVDLAAVRAAHERGGALVTLALVPNTEPHKYGGVLVDETGRVTGFTRRSPTAPPSCHFIGVQVAEAAAFEGVADNVPRESIASIYPALMAARPGSVRGFVSQASFLDIGTPADYLETSLRLARQEERSIEDDCIFWDDVRVERGARLRRCVITDGARVPAAADWSDVTVRVAGAELEPWEERIGDLAVGPLSQAVAAAPERAHGR